VDIDVPSAVEVFTTLRYINVHLLTYLLTYFLLLFDDAIAVRQQCGTCVVLVVEQSFTGHYDEYFGLGTDVESLIYLMLANHTLRKFYPSFMVTIAEVQLQSLFLLLHTQS